MASARAAGSTSTPRRLGSAINCATTCHSKPRGLTHWWCFLFLLSLQLEQSSVGTACFCHMWCHWDIWRPSLFPRWPSSTSTSTLPSLFLLSLPLFLLDSFVPWPLLSFPLPPSLAALVPIAHKQSVAITHSVSHPGQCTMGPGIDFRSVLCLPHISSRIIIKRQVEWSQTT